MEHLDLRDVTLVSHSMGSGEVARYLTRHGAERIARVALISPTLPYLQLDDSNPEGVDPARFEEIVARPARRSPRLPGEPRAGRARGRAARRRGLGRAGGMGPGPVHVVVAEGLARHRRGLHAETDLRDDMASFTVPTLIVHGDRDALVPIEVSGRRAAPMIDDCRLVVYENASHWPFITHRERLNAAVGGLRPRRAARLVLKPGSAGAQLRRVAATL